MEYIATGFIGREFTPGEKLPEDIDPKFLERLLKSGMARAIEDTRAKPLPEPGEADGGEPEADTEAAGAADDEPAEQGKTAPDMRAAHPDAREIAAEYELDMEAEPMEIDISEGIVTEKPKRRRGGKAK